MSDDVDDPPCQGPLHFAGNPNKGRARCRECRRLLCYECFELSEEADEELLSPESCAMCFAECGQCEAIEFDGEYDLRCQRAKGHQGRHQDRRPPRERVWEPEPPGQPT